MSELRHDAVVQLDFPALAQVSGLAECLTFRPGEVVLDCDYRSYGWHRVVRRNGHAPDSDPALAREQAQFGTALPIYAGHDG